MTSELNEFSSIKSILMVYRDLEMLAADMRCLSMALSANENEKYFLKEMGEAHEMIITYQAPS